MADKVLHYWSQEESKLDDLTLISEMALEEARKRRCENAAVKSVTEAVVENDADDFINRKSLKDLTNCQRSKNILNEVSTMS